MNDSDKSQKPRQMKIFCHNCTQKLDVTSLAPFSRLQCPVCGTELIVPVWFDAYLLEEKGGNGGMATVYRAIDPALDREVAIKILKSEISGSPGRAELFLHEARAAATINHYAVVPIYTCGFFEGKAYIVMQFMSGGSLDMKLTLAHGKLPVKDVLLWIRDIADGLENARLHGIVHHDVKPGNILLDGEGKAKIGDFGIAQITVSGKSNTEEEMIQEVAKTWLSPHYVSPEKVRTGKESYEGDIYSLGATFYHLLTGKTPFSHSSVEELLRLRLTELPVAPHLQRPEIDAVLSQLVMSMMSKDPADRPSYKEIIASLDRIIKAKTASPESESIGSVSVSGGKIQSDPEKKKGRRWPKSFFPYVFFPILILLIGIGVLLVWQQGYLNCSFTEDMDAQAQLQDKLNPNPEIAAALSVNDLESAEVFARLIISDPSLTPKKRVTALFQEACCLRLTAFDGAKKEIRSLLSELDKNCSPSGMMAEAPLLAGIRLLSGEISSADDFSDADAVAIISLCRVILAAEDGLDAEVGLMKRLDEFERAMDALPQGSWLNIWKKRLPFWYQIAQNGSGLKKDVEPLFSSLIREEKVWTHDPFASKDPVCISLLESLPDMTSDSFQGESASQMPDLTADAIRSAALKYLERKRPVPHAPAFLTSKGMDKYLKSIPAEQRADEQRRFLMMTQMKAYLSAIARNNPYPAEALSLVDGTDLGEGTIFLSEQYLVYRMQQEDGTENCQRLEWENLPAREVLNIFLYYTIYREKAIRAEKLEPDETSKRLVCAFLRYALFAQWYGFYDEALEFGKKALADAPGIWSQRCTERLLLR